MTLVLLVLLLLTPTHITYTAPYELETALSPTVITDIEEYPCKDIYQYGCSCVVYVQNKGWNIEGDAKDIEINYNGTPFVGNLAKFYYPSNNVYHLAYVEEVYINGNFLVSEWNYTQGEYNERVILKDDPYLIGFIHKLN